MSNTKKMIAIPALALAFLGGGAIAGYTGLAAAQTGTSNQTGFMGMMHRGMPGVHGTIASINGTTLTVTGKNNTTYTVDGSNAKILKMTEGAAPTTETFADLAVGETIGVRGTVSGTSVTATEIMEGDFKGGFGRGGFGHGKGPGVMGKVSAVNGSTITVTDRDGTSVTVEAGAATVEKMVAGALSDVKVGDMIGVQGTRSGTTVTATKIMAGMPAPQQ